MPRNGSGSYSLPSGNPFVPSTVISSSTMNNTMSDIGTALTQSLASDGQTVPVANLPMAAFRHTNVANAQNRNEYAAAGQVQDGSLTYLTSVAGTNTITASLTPSPAAYVAGQTFRFVSAGANTGATTLNINGLGAKNVLKTGTSALVAGDIPSGAVVEVTYDGTQFQLNGQAFATGSLIGLQTFTASGTYTPSAGTRRIIVFGCGGGGAGGGTPSSGGGCSAGAGGASGSSGFAVLTTGFTPTVTVTIGGGGAGSSGASGGNGGNTTFGALITFPGGNGGSVGTLATAAQVITGGAASGAAPSGSSVIGSSGNAGGPAVAFAGNSPHSGMGALSQYGSGGRNIVFNGGTGASDGGAASGFGGGGAGAGSVNAGVSSAGGAGTGGLIIVYEYA